VFLFLIKNILFSQNLIQNGSFENFTAPVNCSGGSGGFDNYANFPVNHVVDYWYSLSSPDYFTPLCNGANNDGAPLNIFGYIQAKNGNAYAGFLTYLKGGETKEYIYQQLPQPLQSGEIYCLSFFVSRVDRSPYSVANIGAYFSNTIPTLYNGIYVNKTPQIINQNGIITDTIGWTQIQGCFTANGGEQYITIGKFNTTGTDTLNSGTNNPILFNPDMSYYYIDDITLIDQTTIGVNELGNGSSVSVYPNPANDVLNICLGNIIENTEIKIYNQLGELVLSEYLTIQNSSLKTHHLQSGVYFYTILVGEKNIKTDKIVIIK
jgi:hypothetical protein